MPRRYYRHDSSSVSADSYRVAPPLPYGRRSRVSRTKTETRVDRPKRRDDISADSVRIAPKVKPWRSRRDHDRGHRSKDTVKALPRTHSKPKTKKKSKHTRHKRAADNESSEYEPPADIRQNPFCKDIWEEPKRPKVRKPPQPQVVPIPPSPKTPKATANKPKNNNKKIAGQTAKTKPTAKPPPPPGGYQAGVPGTNEPTMQPLLNYGQLPAPNYQQLPPPIPNGGYNTQIVTPSQHQPMHNPTYPAAPYNVAPPGLTPTQKLAQMRVHYARLQGQSDPTAQYLESGAPQATGQYSRPLPLPSQYQTNVDQYRDEGAPVNLYEAQEAAKARARKAEEAQRKVAAATDAYKAAVDTVAALEAKGPDSPKVHSSGKQTHKTSAGANGDHVARLEREYREALAAAEAAKQGRPAKNVSFRPGESEIPRVPYVQDSPLTDEESQERGRSGDPRNRRHSSRTTRSQGGRHRSLDPNYSRRDASRGRDHMTAPYYSSSSREHHRDLATPGNYPVLFKEGDYPIYSRQPDDFYCYRSEHLQHDGTHWWTWHVDAA